MNVKIITRAGTEINLPEWQAQYNIANEQIGRNFSLTESRFKTDLVQYGELVVNELLMRFLDAFREAVGPITINSFNRNQEKQNELKAEGFKTAKYSPHVAKIAADIDTKTVEQTREWARKAKEVAAAIGIKIRVGSEQYIKAGQTFIHVDVGPEYYAKGKPFHEQFHPVQWESQICW